MKTFPPRKPDQARRSRVLVIEDDVSLEILYYDLAMPFAHAPPYLTKPFAPEMWHNIMKRYLLKAA